MVLPSYREIVDLIKQGANLEAQQRFVELQEAHQSVREENLRLKDEVSRLGRELELTKTIVWEPPVYYRLVDGAKEGPYCQKCFDSDRKLIRLQLKYGYSDLSCLACGLGYSFPQTGNNL
jgi:hypothetical protein